MDLSQVATILSILAGVSVFFEWRIRTMQAQFKEKIEDKERINQIIQIELKEDIARLEAKIDTLINVLYLKGQPNDQK